MNIGKAKINKNDLDMSVLIPITSENNAYMENLSNAEGLTFSDILNKMIISHKKRGYHNGSENYCSAKEVGDKGKEEKKQCGKSSVKKDKSKGSK